MDQKLSRPTRWGGAARRAQQAMYELQHLRDDWLASREELVEQWKIQRVEFLAALDDLQTLQSEYSAWGIPDNLVWSRQQQKSDAVSSLDFEDLKALVPNLEKIADPLQGFNPVDDPTFYLIDEARGVDVPKAYGRD